MSMQWTFGFIAFFIAVVANRWIMTGALRRLDDQTKLKLIEVFSRRNIWSTMFLVALIISAAVTLSFYPQWGWMFMIGYLVIFLTYLVVKLFLNYRKLQAIRVPASYLKSFFAGYGIFIAGFIVMVLCMAWGTFD